MVTAIAFNWRILRFIVIKTAFIVAFLVPHGKPNNIFEQDKQELFIMNKIEKVLVVVKKLSAVDKLTILIFWFSAVPESMDILIRSYY